VLNFSRDEDKHKTVNRGCAAIRGGKLMGKTFGIALVPVLGGAMLGGTPGGSVGEGAYTLWITSCNFWSKQTVRKSK
jgi:hypothetical protein